MKHYTKEYITQLLHSFMEGRTTLEEEEVLAEYFRTTHQIPKEWEEYKEMFAYFDEGMDDQEVSSVGAKTANNNRKAALWKYISIAASLLLLIGGSVFWVVSKDDGRQLAQSTSISVSKTIKTKPTKGKVTMSQKSDEEGTNKAQSIEEKEVLNKNIGTMYAVKSKYDAPKTGSELAQNTEKIVSTTNDKTPKANEEMIKEAIREYAKMEYELQNVQLEMQRAKIDVINAKMQARGYSVNYTENGDIYYTKNELETDNILEL